jgi:primosomal protein N' (replication factor Y)
MEERLAKQEQIMLFLNRRGYAGFVSCRACGYVMKCPHCEVSLSQHLGGKMVCHYCGYDTLMPKKCPECESPYIAAFGTGTQKVEEAIKKLYPTARVLRMDMDTTSGKDGHEKILSAFANREADILVGTQMIVKGHDFPYVTLVGVIAADLSLYAGDYMSGERTFDLLTQAAGRAGRGTIPGEVVIQTYNPEEYSIRLAALQDYEEFYNTEIMFRTLNDYPPAINMMAILLKSEEQDRLVKASETIADVIKKSKMDIKLIGPADCTIGRISDIYRRVMYIKSDSIDKIISIKNIIDDIKEKRDELKDIAVQFDLNPIISY